MQISKVQSIPKTKNNFELRNQTPTVNPATLKTTKSKAKPKHKIVIIGDSHARGCASRLQKKLKDQYEVIGYVKPSAGAAVLTKTAQQEISGLTEEVHLYIVEEQMKLHTITLQEESSLYIIIC
jgi:hypothetical protein